MMKMGNAEVPLLQNLNQQKPLKKSSVQNCFIKFVPYVKPSNLVLVDDGNKTKLTIERELIRLCYPKFNSR